MLNNKILLNNIKKLCEEHNVKITNLEKELEFGAGIISRWGNGADPSLSKICDIADYFKVSLDEVVGYKTNNIENYDFISTVIKQTTNNQLQWINRTYLPYDYTHEIPTDNNIILHNFNNYPDGQRNIKRFIVKSGHGQLMLNCYLIIVNNAIDKYEFFFYILPNEDSKFVYQKCDQEQLLKLYKTIISFENQHIPEIEADNFKKQFLNEHNVSVNIPENIQGAYASLKDMSQRINEFVNSPEYIKISKHLEKYDE